MSIASLLRGQIADIDSRLPALRQQFADLEARQAQLVAQLSEIKYPVLTLPHDVTLCIWSFVMEPWNPVYEYSESEYVPAQPAPVLASVCRVWRQLALSTTELWSTLIVSWRHTGSRRTISLVSLLLKRAGSIRPLDVDFRSIRRHKHIQKALNTLKPVESRLQRLCISHDEEEFHSPFLYPHDLPQTLPALQVLDLGSFRLSTFYDINEIETPLARSTPRLSYLRVESAHTALRLGFQSSLSNLVTLVLARAQSAETAEMLSAAPRLETLHLGECGFEDAESEFPSPGASRRRGDLYLAC
ncbi:hypothetical protein MIND_00934600 [Mycena indigotica]|uniref:F-box domain-containing protein n=1 Tax=Mycena indigotica TaxID=2126181 RepID=A0A8H6SCH9_9AGAR|nr:uncharacterized protein MIND_00934600 [Mycena indigotica]KAF7297021.1 hypothetical protein MIND_00934600 [Mycena indigotica]